MDPSEESTGSRYVNTLQSNRATMYIMASLDNNVYTTWCKPNFEYGFVYGSKCTNATSSYFPRKYFLIIASICRIVDTKCDFSIYNQTLYRMKIPWHKITGQLVDTVTCPITVDRNSRLFRSVHKRHTQQHERSQSLTRLRKTIYRKGPYTTKTHTARH